MPMEVLLAAGVVVGIIVFAIVDGVKRGRRERAVRVRLAKQCGGEFRLPSSWASGERERIEVRVGAVLVTMEWYTISHGKRRHRQTRWFARFAGPNAPVFKVYREGALSSVGKALGTQDVVLGTDHEFDAHFMVKCDDPEAVRAVWTPASMQLMVTRFLPNFAQADGEIVEVIVGGHVEDAARMQAGFDLVAALAGPVDAAG